MSLLSNCTFTFNIQTETEQVALDYLSEVVQKLNDNPGLFENYQKRLREMFLELANNHFVMSNAIETIFEQVCRMSKNSVGFLIEFLVLL